MGVEENKVEKYLDSQVKALGGITRKWVSPGRDGVPDRIVVLPGGAFFGALIHFVEVKTLHGKLTVRQQREIELLRSLGCSVSVVHGKNEVDELICRLKLKMGI